MSMSTTFELLFPKLFSNNVRSSFPVEYRQNYKRVFLQQAVIVCVLYSIPESPKPL